MTKISEDQVEAMLESKEAAMELINESDAFMVVTLEGVNVHSSRGYYCARDKLTLAGAIELVQVTMMMETISGTNAVFVPEDKVKLN